MANPEHFEVARQGAEAIAEWRKDNPAIRLSLTEADLSGTNLSGAELSGAELRGANLGGADLAGAHFVATSLANLDLSVGNGPKGLEQASHDGPSTIGIDTLFKSNGNIPEAFLRGCGVPEEFIKFIRLAGEFTSRKVDNIKIQEQFGALAKALRGDEARMLSGSMLYIEPEHPAAETGVIDAITRKMCGAFRKARYSDGVWGGIHECICGAQSSCRDYHLPNGSLTNSLCMHYVAHHRSEVPTAQLQKIAAFTMGEAHPTDEELQGPQLVLARVQSLVEQRLGQKNAESWTGWGLDVMSLSRGLRGGILPQMQGVSPTRDDAENLLGVISCIGWDTMPIFEKAVQKEHGDLRTWGKEALSVPGWRRDLWVSPLMTLIEQADCDSGGPLWSLRHLGLVAGAAVSTLIELSKTATDQFKNDLGTALDHIGQLPNALIEPEAIPCLVEVATGSQYDVRFRVQAARILGCSGLAVDIAVPVLLEFALRDANNSEWASAVLCGTLGQSLGYVGEPGVKDWGRVGLPHLRKAQKDADDAIRHRATELLDRLNADEKQAVSQTQDESTGSK